MAFRKKVCLGFASCQDPRAITFVMKISFLGGETITGPVRGHLRSHPSGSLRPLWELAEALILPTFVALRFLFIYVGTDILQTDLMPVWFYLSIRDLRLHLHTFC